KAITASGHGIDAEFVSGNPKCADLGYAHSAKIDPVPSTGTVTLPSGDTITFTYDSTDADHDGITYEVAWTSTLPLAAVIVKAGNGANVYRYGSEALNDTGLATPNNNGGQQAAISHLDFCFDDDIKVVDNGIKVSKTARTTFRRNLDWKIEKRAAVP